MYEKKLNLIYTQENVTRKQWDTILLSLDWKKINKFDYTKYWRAHGLMDILNMLWKSINWYIHLKNKFVLSFKFKHSHTPSRKECQRIKTKQIKPACTNRWTNEKIRHLQIIPENCTNFLWTSSCMFMQKRRRSGKQHWQKGNSRSAIFSVLNVCALSHISKIFKHFES